MFYALYSVCTIHGQTNSHILYYQFIKLLHCIKFKNKLKIKLEGTFETPWIKSLVELNRSEMVVGQSPRRGEPCYGPSFFKCETCKECDLLSWGWNGSNNCMYRLQTWKTYILHLMPVCRSWFTLTYTNTLTHISQNYEKIFCGKKCYNYYRIFYRYFFYVDFLGIILYCFDMGRVNNKINHIYPLIIISRLFR